MLFFRKPVKADGIEVALAMDVNNIYIAQEHTVSLPEVKQPEPAPKPSPQRNSYGKTYGFNPCSCVSYVQKFYPGIRTANGLARTWPVNSKTPTVGAVVVLREGSGAGHVAIVTNISATHLTVTESNYTRCRQTSGRTIPINSRLIIGFYQ